MNGRNIGWTFILVAGIFEVVWALALKRSDGFNDPVYTIIFLIGLVISMYFLSRALGTGLPIGTAYAVWVGIGAIGTVVFGIILFDDPLTVVRMMFVALIVIGIVGLQVTCPKPEEDGR